MLLHEAVRKAPSPLNEQQLRRAERPISPEPRHDAEGYVSASFMGQDEEGQQEGF